MDNTIESEQKKLQLEITKNTSLIDIIKDKKSGTPLSNERVK